MATASYPYAPESMDATLAEFLRRWPAYEQTRSLDELRATEYARLNALDQVYLDYTGGGLYAESQLREHMALLSGGVFGNPHSTNPTSQAATEHACSLSRAWHAATIGLSSFAPCSAERRC